MALAKDSLGADPPGFSSDDKPVRPAPVAGSTFDVAAGNVSPLPSVRSLHKQQSIRSRVDSCQIRAQRQAYSNGHCVVTGLRQRVLPKAACGTWNVVSATHPEEAP